MIEFEYFDTELGPITILADYEYNRDRFGITVQVTNFSIIDEDDQVVMASTLNELNLEDIIAAIEKEAVREIEEGPEASEECV